MVKYEPEPTPFDPENPVLGQYLSQEFRRIAGAFEEVESVTLTELHAAPPKPRNGMIVLADGSDWDPGSGAGFYGFSEDAWVLMQDGVIWDSP